MQVGRVQGNNQIFKGLYIKHDLGGKILYQKTSSKFLNDFVTIKNNIITNKLDNKRFVDVVLGEKDNNFYAMIISKEQGIPNNPNAKIIIDTTKKGLAKFKKWVNEWNHAYNPKTLKETEKINELIKKTNWKDTPLDKALKRLYK